MNSANSAFPVESSLISGVGFSDRILLAISIGGFVALAGTIYSLLMSRLKTAEEELDGALTAEERLARADVATLTRAQRRARAKLIMKEQRRAAVNHVLAAPAEHDGEDEHGQELVLAEHVEHDDDDFDNGEVRPILSRQERQHAAKAAEKEERLLFQDERQRQQKEAQLTAQQQRKERLAAEAVRLEQEKILREQERGVRETIERDAWVIFLVPGTAETAKGANTRGAYLVSDFLRDCQSNRVVRHAKLAASLGVTTERVFERIEQLVREGRVAGFLQDNQFVYVSDDELGSIASMVSDQGSASLKDIAAICQQVIGN